MKYFAVRDKAIGAFMPMFAAKTRALAIRMVEDAARDSNGQFAKHLADYSFFELGEFDEDSGSFTAPDGGPQLIVQLFEFAKPE